MELDIDPLASGQLADAARTAVAAAPHASLVTVAARGSFDVAGAVAATLTEAHPTHEVVLVAPEGVRWSVSDVETELLARVRYAPEEHRHLVVADAHRAAGVIHDRLLKLLEEGVLGSTVWLTHPQSAPLPPALRGRAALDIAASAASRTAIATKLAAEHPDLDVPAAEDLLSRADDNFMLAHTVARFGFDEQLATYSTGRTASRPTSDAQVLTVALAHLAVATHHKTKKAPVAPVAKKGTAPTADLARLSPQAKATLRRLVEAVMDRWERDIVRELATSPTPAGRRLCAQMAALRQVRDTATYSPPVPMLLSAALVAANS